MSTAPLGRLVLTLARMQLCTVAKRLPEGVYLRGRTYWIRYSTSGRQVRESTGLKVDHPGALRSATALRAKRIQADFDRKHFPGRLDCYLEVAVDEYLDARADAKTIENIRGRLKHALRFFGRKTEIGELTHARIRAWQRELEQEEVRGGRRRDLQTVAHFLRSLRAAVNAARRAKLTGADPFDGYPIPKNDRRRDRVATPGELARLVQGARDAGNHELADIITLAISTGLRQAKIVEMRRSDIDFERRIWRVPQTPGGKPTPKRMPLSDAAMEVLERRRGGDRIFAGVKPVNVSQQFKRLTNRLGIYNLRFHDIRHTVFSGLERAGVSTRTIKELSGHATLDNLFRYQHLDDEDLHEAIRKRKTK